MSRERIQFMRTATPSYHPGWGGRKYTSWQEEQQSWKQPGYIGDCSSLWAVEVRGSDATDRFVTVASKAWRSSPLASESTSFYARLQVKPSPTTF